MAATPVILYNSAGMPIGARIVTHFYRPPNADDASSNYPAGYTKPKVASVVAFNGEAGATDLGSYVVEDVAIDLGGTPVERSGTFGEDSGDPSLVRRAPTLSMTVQMEAAGTPTLCPGDFCTIYIGMKATSTKAAPVVIPASRWFISSDGISMVQNQANKFALKLNLDRTNSDPLLAEF